MSEENKEEKKEIRIVTGDSSDLNISKVSEHLTSMKPKSKEEDSKNKKNIVIPEVKKIKIEDDGDENQTTNN